MVAIPGGSFVMGSRHDEKGRKLDEGPQREITLKPFWMSSTEVTWELFDLYLEGKIPVKKAGNADLKGVDAITRPSPSYVDPTYGFGKDGRPVVAISHHHAMEFCRWLSLATSKHYRLPTEVEWEYACRAGTKTAYFFGNDPAQLGEYAWFDKNADDATHPVGKKKPNPWGLFDMYGNVAEWCLDHYGATNYIHLRGDGRPADLVQLPTERRYPHVVRGGSWADAPPACRSAARRGSEPSWNKSDPGRPQSIWWLADADFIGFRVVRAVEEYDILKGIKSKVTVDSK